MIVHLIVRSINQNQQFFQKSNIFVGTDPKNKSTKSKGNLKNYFKNFCQQYNRNKQTEIKQRFNEIVNLIKSNNLKKMKQMLEAEKQLGFLFLIKGNHIFIDVGVFFVKIG